MKTEQMIEMKPQHTSFFIKPPDPGARLRRLPLAALTLIFVSALSLSGCPGSDSSSDPGDTSPPVFQSAMVIGATLTITFNENLNSPLPAGLEADFTVRVTPDGGTESPRAVNSASGAAPSDSMIELTLENAVIDTDGVTVEYTANNSRQITDLSDNILASFAAQTIRNNTVAIPTPDDNDGDGVLNAADNCPTDFNPDQVNSDGDDVGNACDTDDDNDTELDTTDVDDDGDGLIEIHDLDMLNNVRNKLNGTAYNDGSSDDNTTGCGGLNGVTTCSGYELSRDLNFAEADSYADNVIDAAWRPTGSDPATATNPGWMPIGNNSDDSDNTRFTTTFEGNGNTITGLYVRVAPDVGDAYAGLFGFSGSGAGIRNTGVVTAAVFASSSSSDADAFAGGLVGVNVRGSISNSYATGSASASSSSDADAFAGGLVGFNSGSISNSYATGSASASASSSSDADAFAGGLVGVNVRGSISNSYATGSVSAASSSSFFSANAGGLVGLNNGSISNSYATGSTSASGTADADANAGGLVGVNVSGSISNSYATGSASAGTASAGGLVGLNDGGSISNSYWDRDTVVLIEDGAIVSAEDQDIGDDGDHTGVTALTSNRMQATTGTGTFPDLADNGFDLGSANEYPLVEYAEIAAHCSDSRHTDQAACEANDENWLAAGTECEVISTNTAANDGDLNMPDCGDLLPGQAVRMASGFLRFSDTAIGEPSSTDFAFFYDIGSGNTINISGTGVNGTTAGSYAIEDAVGTAPTVTGTTISGLGALSAGDEFYLRVTFTKGSDSFTQRYRFKK